MILLSAALEPLSNKKAKNEHNGSNCDDIEIAFKDGSDSTNSPLFHNPFDKSFLPGDDDDDDEAMW